MITINVKEQETIEKMVPYMDIKKFREFGFLQEVNRQFFHPLGLALEISRDEDGTEWLSGVWDYRDDDVGMAYEENTLNQEKADNVEKLRQSKVANRLNELGYVIQPIRNM